MKGYAFIATIERIFAFSPFYPDDVIYFTDFQMFKQTYTSGINITIELNLYLLILNKIYHYKLHLWILQNTFLTKEPINNPDESDVILV